MVIVLPRHEVQSRTKRSMSSIRRPVAQRNVLPERGWRVGSQHADSVTCQTSQMVLVAMTCMTMSLTKSEHSCHSRFPSYSVHPGAFWASKQACSGQKSFVLPMQPAISLFRPALARRWETPSSEVWSPAAALGSAQLAMW